MSNPTYEIVYPRGGLTVFRAPAAGLLSQAMRPASLVYRGVSSLVRSVRIGERRPLDLGAVVVSVGNLEVGGNGKTPFAIYLVNELVRRGYRPAYVSRGFKSEAESLGVVTLVVPRVEEPRGASSGVRVLFEGVGRLTEAVGDEGAMVAMRCPGVPLAFSRHRRRAIEVVCETFRPTHVILDDAFQTWGVARDLDIVLLDAEHPLGNGRILPAGSLREGPSALGRAGAIGFNGIEDEERLATVARWADEAVGRAVPVFGVRRRLSFLGASSGAEEGRPEGPVAALSSIGRPRQFEESLISHGIDVEVALRFPDHHRYRRDDVRRIEAALRTRRLERMVTTEKDWVKLREVRAPGGHLWIARLELCVFGQNPVEKCEKPQVSTAASR